MEDESYEKIWEEANAKPETTVGSDDHAALEVPSERQKAAEPEKAEPEKAAEPQKAAEPPQKPQKRKKAEDGAPKEKPPRMICEGCGRSYSIHTKRHVRETPKGFEKKENVPPEPVPPPMPVGLERQITLADVTQFLLAESKARRDKRRDDLLAKMF